MEDTGHNGVFPGQRRLSRKNVLNQLNKKLVIENKKFVIMASPPATGKTSILQMFSEIPRISSPLIIYIRLRQDIELFELLRQNGIDLKNYTLTFEPVETQCYLLLDDAQLAYDKKDFWETLIKDIKALTLLKHIKVVISATHLLGGSSSPAVFHDLAKIDSSSMLLSHDESLQLLNDPVMGLPSNMGTFDVLKGIMARECGGVICALRIASEFLADKIKLLSTILEAQAIQIYLSNDILVPMARCFGDELNLPWKPEIRKHIINALAGEIIASEDDQLRYLTKCGLLVFSNGSYAFSSPLAKRYFARYFYGERSSCFPSSLNQLIENTIKNMSSNTLTNSVVCSTDFPKEAVFQHLFMQGLALLTLPTCNICFELSKIFPSDGIAPGVISGAIDFYINSTLGWGIELFVNGSSISEYISQFGLPNGKYAPLEVQEYAVVDFRVTTSGEPTNVVRHENRITVFFKQGDYTSCFICFGLNLVAKQVRLLT